jgi:hypothetical protein
MNVVPIKPHAAATQGHDPEHLTILSRAMASWFVRLDNSFFDVDDLGIPRHPADERADDSSSKASHPHPP